MLTDHAMPLWSTDQGQYVECLACGEAFHPDVLNDSGEDLHTGHTVFRTLMIGIMVSMMDSDGSADSRELEAIASIYSELAGAPVPPSVLQRGIELARTAGPGGAIELAANFNSRLNQLSRELVFRSALYVSAADGELHQEEMDFLEKVGRSLGLDKAHMGAIIDSAREEGAVSLGGEA